MGSWYSFAAFCCTATEYRSAANSALLYRPDATSGCGLSTSRQDGSSASGVPGSAAARTALRICCSKLPRRMSSREVRTASASRTAPIARMTRSIVSSARTASSGENDLKCATSLRTLRSSPTNPCSPRDRWSLKMYPSAPIGSVMIRNWFCGSAREYSLPRMPFSASFAARRMVQSLPPGTCFAATCSIYGSSTSDRDWSAARTASMLLVAISLHPRNRNRPGPPG